VSNRQAPDSESPVSRMVSPPSGLTLSTSANVLGVYMAGLAVRPTNLAHRLEATWHDPFGS
jgi:hypothetical protein